MRSRSLLGGAALAALVVVALLWRLLGAPVGGARAPEGDGMRGDAALSAEPEQAEGVAAEPTAPGAARTALGADASAAEAGTCLIRVVRADTGAPVPGTHLWVQREDVTFSSPEWVRAMGRANDVEVALRSGLGRELEADADGEALVPRPERGVNLVAALGDLHGEAMLWPGDVERVIEVAPYRSLVVDVVDRTGSAVADMPVVLFWGEFDPLERDETFLTDEKGRAWIPKLERLLGSDYRGPVRLTLGGGVPCEPVEFASEAIPSETVRLVAGEFGSVLVYVVDRQGRALAYDAQATLDVYRSDGQPLTLAERVGTSLRAALVGGRARFACVGLGWEITVRVLAGERSLSGPTTAGEERRVTLEASDQRLRVRGEVRGMPSAWLTAESPGAMVIGHLGRVAQFSFWQREPGPFDWPLSTSKEPGELTGVWAIRLQRAGGPMPRTSAMPTLDEEARVLDFGTIEFDAETVLATVRIVDEGDGRPWRPTLQVMGRGMVSSVPCDARGRALVSGSPSQLPLQVCASHPERLPVCGTIERPGSELTLVLRNGAEVRGSLVLPPRMPFDEYELGLDLDVAPTDGEARTSRTNLVAGARFRFVPLPTGRATLRVTWLGRDLLERPGIELVAGERVELEPIDITALLRRFRLTVEIGGGAPWRSGALWVFEPDPDRSYRAKEIGAGGRVVLFRPRDTLDTWVAGRGVQPEFFRGVRDGDRLTLSPAPVLVVHVPDGVGALGPLFELVVRAERVRPDDVPFEADEETDFEPGVVGADGRARLEVPWPGEYELAWSVRRTDSGAVAVLDLGPRQAVVVGEAGASPEVEARLDADGLARALAEIGG